VRQVVNGGMQSQHIGLYLVPIRLSIWPTVDDLLSAFMSRRSERWKRVD